MSQHNLQMGIPNDDYTESGVLVLFYNPELGHISVHCESKHSLPDLLERVASYRVLRVMAVYTLREYRQCNPSNLHILEQIDLTSLNGDD